MHQKHLIPFSNKNNGHRSSEDTVQLCQVRPILFCQQFRSSCARRGSSTPPFISRARWRGPDHLQRHRRWHLHHSRHHCETRPRAACDSWTLDRRRSPCFGGRHILCAAGTHVALGRRRIHLSVESLRPDRRLLIGLDLVDRRFLRRRRCERGRTGAVSRTLLSGARLGPWLALRSTSISAH